MIDRASEAATEARLREFLAAELRRAETDFPHIELRQPRARGGTTMLGLLAVVACLAVVVLVVRLSGAGLPPGPGGNPLGSDGMPLSIGGQPVLRGVDIETRMSTGDPASFLAGGYLVLHGPGCGSASPAPSDGCTEDWRLDDVGAGDASHSIPLSTVGGGATFVRTSGAPTVIRAKVADRTGTLLIEGVEWRQPTKGRIPEAATPSGGGEVIEALVPDFVTDVGGPTGETVVGYSPKDQLLHPQTTTGGTLENPPQDLPVPVYGEDLTTLVGYMVPGHGFVPLGSSVPSGAVGLGSPSVAPSGRPTTSGDIVDGFKLGASETCSPPIGSVDPRYSGSSCAGMIDLATAALDTREASHAAIISIDRYADGTQPGTIDITGNATPPTLASRHPGPDVTVFVFTLADGSSRATGVACTDATSCIGVAFYPN